MLARRCRRDEELFGGVCVEGERSSWAMAAAQAAGGARRSICTPVT
jgi:hypothetical protein